MLESVTQSAGKGVAEASETSSPSEKRAETANLHQHFAQLPSDEFSSKIALFDGPRVAITVGDTLKKTYHLPKALLVSASPYFTAAFEGAFKEGIEQKIELDCTIATFDLMIQYLYTGVFNTPLSLTQAQQISALLDFCILVDILLLQNSPMIVGKMKAILEESTTYLEKEHIRKAATELPSGHAVRKLFADIMVDLFVNYNSNAWGPVFRFEQEVQDVDEFAADMARACVDRRRRNNGWQ
ncbi:hypothetical protein ACMFMF_010538 [Clarireedia jacksonii]